MNTLSSQVQRIRATLRKEIQSGGPDHSKTQPIINQLVGLVLRALNDDEHPLAQNLVELRIWIDSHRTVPAGPPGRKVSSRAPRNRGFPPGLELSDKHLFLPDPGNGSPQLRRFWPLQLLLFGVARSSRRAELEQYVGLTEQKIVLAANEAFPHSVGLWSNYQFWVYVEQALEFVEYPDPPEPFRLDGQTLHSNRENLQVRLSARRATFLKLLLNSPNTPVPLTSFKTAGISNPKKLKLDLLRQLQNEGVEIIINGTKGAYMLVLPAS